MQQKQLCIGIRYHSIRDKLQAKSVFRRLNLTSWGNCSTGLAKIFVTKYKSHDEKMYFLFCLHGKGQGKIYIIGPKGCLLLPDARPPSSTCPTPNGDFSPQCSHRSQKRGLLSLISPLWTFLSTLMI